ncbi:MAG: nucleotidyltransferase domain-containing protein [Nitrospirae bacterium]|nr:nucleotidyltransferase domain-containing protein [Nitrospirota bacterium]
MNIPTIPYSILQNLNIAIVYLFGSQIQGYTNPLSDIDIGIVFTRYEVLKDTTNLYTDIYDILTDIFPCPQEVDIVFLQQTSPVFQYEVIKYGKVLYETDPLFRADYEEQVAREYMDFEPVLLHYSEALLLRR